MLIKVKDLDEINRIALTQLIEETLQEGMALVVGDDDAGQNYICDKIQSSEYKQLVQDILMGPNNLFEVNKQIAGKEIEVSELCDCVTEETLDYILSNERYCGGCDVYLPKEYAEV